MFKRSKQIKFGFILILSLWHLEELTGEPHPTQTRLTSLYCYYYGVVRVSTDLRSGHTKKKTTRFIAIPFRPRCCYSWVCAFVELWNMGGQVEEEDPLAKAARAAEDLYRLRDTYFPTNPDEKFDRLLKESDFAVELLDSIPPGKNFETHRITNIPVSSIWKSSLFECRLSCLLVIFSWWDLGKTPQLLSIPLCFKLPNLSWGQWDSDLSEQWKIPCWIKLCLLLFFFAIFLFLATITCKFDPF